MVLRRWCSVCRQHPAPTCQRCFDQMVPVGVMTELPEADRAVALFRYDRLAQTMILAGKNRGRRDVLRCAGQLLALAARSLAHDVDGVPRVVTWVPASRAGRRRRGYDQGEILAAAVAAELGLNCVRLLRRGRGSGQTGRCRAARLEGPQFVAVRPRPARANTTGTPTSRCPPATGSPVLLVDDVISTGSSMRAAIATLNDAGFGRVSAAAIAWNRRPQDAASGPSEDEPQLDSVPNRT